MNPSSSLSEAARRGFDTLSVELQRSGDDDNFTEELEEFLEIEDNNHVDDGDFYKSEHEDEDWVICMWTRNY